MFARYTTVRGDPARVDAVIDLVDGQTRGTVEASPGCCGFAVLADARAGVILGASYWDSADSLRASESALADTRAAAAEALDGQVSIESFEVLVGFRRTIPARGALVRLGRFDIDPTRVDQAVNAISDNVPQVKGADGLCSFQMLANRETGSGIVVTCWANQAALDAFWPTAEQLRARASDRAGLRFGTLDNLTMIRTTVRLD
jgi:quinol monooxygenase YgiN